MYWKLMFNQQNSLENASITFRFSWQMLQGILQKGHFRWVASWGGGGVPRKNKKKLLRICWNMLSFWNFWNPTNFFLVGGGGGVGKK